MNVRELSSPTTVGVAFVKVAQLMFVVPKSSADCNSKLGNPYGHKIVTSPGPDDSVRSSDRWIIRRLVSAHELRQTEIQDFDQSIVRQKQVLGLQVTVHDSFVVSGR